MRQRRAWRSRHDVKDVIAEAAAATLDPRPTATWRKARWWAALNHRGGSTVNASVCESPRSGSTAVVDGATFLASIVPAECGPLVVDQPHLVDGSRLAAARHCSSPARRRSSRGRTPPSPCRRSESWPDTVRTSGAANTCSAVDGAGCRPQRHSNSERTEPDDQRRRGGQHDGLPALDPPVQHPHWIAAHFGQQSVPQLVRRLDSGGRRHHGHGFPDGPDFVGECCRDVRGSGGDASLDIGELSLRHRVQRVRRREGDQVGIIRLGHVIPRHLRRPRMASRIRDLIVARFADNRSDTWTYVSPS